MSKYVYGIDIGGTTIKMGLFNIVGKLLKKWEIETDTSNNGSNIINQIFNEISKLTPNLDEVLGYGFGVPGPVVDNHISIVVNLGWKDVNLRTALSKLLNNNNIYVGNDANVATLGEAAYGAGRGKSAVAMLTLGTGVGAGIVVNQKLIEGFHGAAGEIGHLNVFPKYVFKCNCGNSGCLETVASATGMRNIYYRLKESFTGDSPLFRLEQPSAKAIVDAAKKNDEIALNTVNETSKYIGYACSVLSVITNPEVIVIGGGLSNSGDFLLDKVRDYFQVYHFAAVQSTEILKAVLGNDAGIYGAARMVINND